MKTDISTKDFTMFCPSCGSPNMEVEALVECRVPVLGRTDPFRIEIDWEDGRPLTPSSDDDLPHLVMGCGACDTPIMPGEQGSVVISTVPNAFLWDTHPFFLNGEWAKDVERMESLMPKHVVLGAKEE